MISFRVLISAAALAVAPLTVSAKTCGGDFNGWMTKLKAEAVSKGHSKAQVNKFFRSARIDPKVLKADRSQGVFRLTFTEFAGRAISSGRMSNGKKNMKKYKSTFTTAQQKYGVQPAVLNRILGFGNRLWCCAGQFQHTEFADHTFA
jgi:membrane-bound lytic murein transglycosylase B